MINAKAGKNNTENTICLILGMDSIGVSALATLRKSAKESVVEIRNRNLNSKSYKRITLSLCNNLEHNVVLTGGDGTGRPRRNLNGNRPCLTRPSAAFCWRPSYFFGTRLSPCKQASR